MFSEKRPLFMQPAPALLWTGTIALGFYAALAGLPILFTAGPSSQQVYWFEGLVAAVLASLAGLIFSLAKFSENSRRSSRELQIILAFAVIFRLLLLPQLPWLSNDIYRYGWDAHLLQSGVNPYLYPPEAPQLEALREAENYPHLSHKYVPTVYPPLLQLLFWAGKNLGEHCGLAGMIGIKSLFVLFDLLLVIALFKILPQFHLDPRWALLYAWHPLAIIEIAGSGHSDGVGVLFMLLALAALHKNCVRLGSVFLALAFLVKFISILLLPFLFLIKTRRKKIWQALTLFVLIVLASYAPFLTAGNNLISGLLIYSAKWRFNDGIFPLLFTPLHALLPDRLVVALMIPPDWEMTAQVLATRRTDLALLITKTIMAALFSCWYAYVWLRAKKIYAANHVMPWPLITLTLFTAFFLLSPTLQPWYLLWILPLLCLTIPAAILTFVPHQTENRQSGLAATAPSILPQKYGARLWLFLTLLTGAVFWSYWILVDYFRSGIWEEQGWIKWMEYGAPLLLSFCAFPMRSKNLSGFPSTPER